MATHPLTGSNQLLGDNLWFDFTLGKPGDGNGVTGSTAPDVLASNPYLTLDIGDLVGGASSPGLVFGLDGSLFDPFAGPDGGGASGLATDAISSSQSSNNSAAGGSGPSDNGLPLSDVGLGGTAAITLIDNMSFAKGPGGGGGGGHSGGSGGTTYSYWSGQGDGDAGFDIHINFTGSGWTNDLEAAFKNAADYYTTVITSDIGSALYHGKIINDLNVTAELKAIDGTGGILGQSGPTAVYTANDLTATGQMQFDSADAQNFYNLHQWQDIVTHELTHVLGFGSLWNYGSHAGLVNGDQYLGPAGVAAYDAELLTPATYIPVETDGGSGTAGAHWDEQTLGSELMTGWLNPLVGNNDPNYLSKFSVMSLRDLGYTMGTNGSSYIDYPYDTPFIA
jgi:Leishmanolysin